MMTREEALAYGMTFDNVYEEKPFRDPNWQLVRIKRKLKKHFCGSMSGKVMSI